MPLRNESFRYRKSSEEEVDAPHHCLRSKCNAFEKKISVCNYDRWALFPFFYLLFWIWPPSFYFFNAARLFWLFCFFLSDRSRFRKCFIFFCESDQVTLGAAISWAWLVGSDIARSVVGETKRDLAPLHLHQDQQRRRQRQEKIDGIKKKSENSCYS